MFVVLDIRQAVVGVAYKHGIVHGNFGEATTVVQFGTGNVQRRIYMVVVVECELFQRETILPKYTSCASGMKNAVR